MAHLQAPTKPCHNCRRQRLRCDRSYPHCNKCLHLGKECLGYGQLFRWTGAVASRGKLAGKTSSADADPTLDHQHNGSSDDKSPARGPSSSLTSESMDRQLVSMSPTDSTSSLEIAGPWVLVDPLYQDMTQDYRYYLSYFTERVCKDLVSFDLPDRNPFRSLLPLTRAHPLLQHIIVASSAAHMSNLVRPSVPPLIGPKGVLEYPSRGAASQRALADALTAKHKALKLMHRAVQNIDSVGVEVVLATALFFINVELIESGKHGWKAHLEGVGKMMTLLPPSDVGTQDLRDYMLSDCFSYFVLASAFMPATSTVQSYFNSAHIPDVLQKATANSYICCPPEVLDILYAAAQLSNVKTVDETSALQVALAATELLARAQAFDMATWAVDALAVPYLSGVPLQSRVNAGMAHCLAACLYIVQAIPQVEVFVGPTAAAELDRAIFEKLSQIPPEDPNFKATSWPTFIAGAGSNDPKRRTWVMDRLQSLVHCCPWGFLYTAMETLQVIWHLDASESGHRSWIQTLKDPEMNFLIV